MTTVDAQQYDGPQDFDGQQNVVVRGWNAFTTWRRSRPFWAGLWTIVSALWLWSVPFLFELAVNHKLNLAVSGVAGISTMAVAPMMIVMALAIWFAPSYRVFAGVFTIICALLSMVVSNFGGFVLGMLFGVLGGGLAFSWSPRLTEEQVAAQERAAEAYREALTASTAGSAKSAPSTDGPKSFDGVAAHYLPEDSASKPTPAEQPAGTIAYTGSSLGSTSFPQVAPTLPQNRPMPSAEPLAAPLNQQRTASDSVPTATALTGPPQDVVPPLPSAEDTPLGA
jgi:hypothetical protein